MKKIFIPVIVIVLNSCSTSSFRGEAEIFFKNTEYNFDAILYKNESVCNFEFTNPGNKPLVISNIESSCGCTAANWTKEPIKPGKIKKQLYLRESC